MLSFLKKHGLSKEEVLAKKRKRDEEAREKQEEREKLEKQRKERKAVLKDR